MSATISIGFVVHLDANTVMTKAVTEKSKTAMEIKNQILASLIGYTLKILLKKV